jgi:hypothetical protein
MRFPDWPRDAREPQLGDVVYQESFAGAGDHARVRRAYLIVGVEETRSGFRLVMERVEYGTLPESLNPEAIWAFHNLPRG